MNTYVRKNNWITYIIIFLKQASEFKICNLDLNLSSELKDYRSIYLSFILKYLLNNSN